MSNRVLDEAATSAKVAELQAEVTKLSEYARDVETDFHRIKLVALGVSQLMDDELEGGNLPGVDYNECAREILNYIEVIVKPHLEGEIP